MVTGAAGNLGRAIVLGLRERGYGVVAIDRNADAVTALARESGVDGVACDLLDAGATDKCADEVWRAHGPVSILVNAVGLIYSAPLVNVTAREERRHSLDAWRRVLDLNLTAVFTATASFVDRMVSTRTRGVVVNLSSVAAAGNAGQGAYSAAKAGLNAATAAWAKELGILGIRFVAIAPGFIDVPSTRAAMPEQLLQDWVRRTPLRRLGSPADVVSAVLLAIDNEHLTGKVIEIDGGLSL